LLQNVLFTHFIHQRILKIASQVMNKILSSTADSNIDNKSAY